MFYLYVGFSLGRQLHSDVQAGEGLVLAGPSAMDSKERFMTCARASNEREPTPAEMKSEGWRQVTNSVCFLLSVPNSE